MKSDRAKEWGDTAEALIESSPHSFKAGIGEAKYDIYIYLRSQTCAWDVSWFTSVKFCLEKSFIGLIYC